MLVRFLPRTVCIAGRDWKSRATEIITRRGTLSQFAREACSKVIVGVNRRRSKYMWWKRVYYVIMHVVQATFSQMHTKGQRRKRREEGRADRERNTFSLFELPLSCGTSHLVQRFVHVSCSTRLALLASEKWTSTLFAPSVLKHLEERERKGGRRRKERTEKARDGNLRIDSSGN